MTGVEKMNGAGVSYRRVSTVKQVQEGEGLNIQHDRINAFCEENGYECVADFSDEGASGAKAFFTREGLMKLLNYCKENCDSIQFVFVDKVDRLSRDLMQQLFIEKELSVIGIKILFTTQDSLNGDDAATKLMRQIMGAFAEFEREMIKQRIEAGIKKKASKGDRPAGRQAFGYTYSIDRHKNTVINEAEADVVRNIFKQRLAGRTLEQIASYLNSSITPSQRSLFTPCNRDRKWFVKGVQVILTNKYYLGIMSYGDVVIQGNHEPIIDQETWRQVSSMGRSKGYLSDKAA